MSKTVFRYDERSSLKSPTRTAQGFLKAEGHAARVGIYKYRRADGSTQYELRPEEEVFHPDSLASYDGAPVTIGHPRRADGEPEDVTAENVRRHEVGTVMGGGRRDGDRVATTSLIKDAAAIRKIENGMHELSPGYRIRLDETPGHDARYATPDNPRGFFHAVQRDIRINHHAVVDQARGGSGIRLRMDDAEMVLRDDAASTAAARPVLPVETFAVPEDQGMPIGDVLQIRDAMSRFDGYRFLNPEQRKAAYRRIVRAGLERDVDVSRFAAEHRADSMAVMTTADKGHQHLIDPRDWNGCERSAGDTSYAVSEGETNSHSHPWIRDSSGKLTIGESEGHAHGILVEDAGSGVITGARP